MTWSLRYFSAAVRDDLLGFPPGLLARYLRYADRMEQFGPDLGMPHTRAIGKGLFELRLQSIEGVGRVMYCVTRGGGIVMLHAFEKKSRKTPNADLQIARQRQREVLRDQP